MKGAMRRVILIASVLIVGLAIAAINADAAREIYEAAREERRSVTENVRP